VLSRDEPYDKQQETTALIQPQVDRMTDWNRERRQTIAGAPF
jgi:hypothetical protein